MIFFPGTSFSRFSSVAKTTCVVLSVVLLAGCGSKETGPGPFLLSKNGGKSFEQSITIDKEKTIASADLLTFAQDPANRQRFIMGTSSSGLLVTENRGESWKKIVFPPLRSYAVAIHPHTPAIMYATGVYGSKGKIYKTEDGGEEWKEIYTEPGEKTSVTALFLQKNAPETVWAIVDNGVMIVSPNGGQSWRNHHTFSDKIDIVITDPQRSDVAYLYKQKEGSLLRTKDTFKTFETLPISTVEKDTKSGKKANIFSLVTDPQRSGVLYMGTDDGLWRSVDYGTTWEDLNVIGSSRGFPVTAVAVSPHTTDELMYVAGQAIYKSGDRAQWAVYELPSDRTVRFLHYDMTDPERIYLGLRKK